LTAYIYGTKHVIDNWAMALETIRGLLQVRKFRELWSTNGLNRTGVFTHPRRFCILLHCQALHTKFSKWNSTRLRQMAGSKLC